ncbi:MAG: GNAT family N-acetyltransferase [Bacteroidota bacterium]|nr:GNAT family N-acetyltransferase [Bacteroidota bacterium]
MIEIKKVDSSADMENNFKIRNSVFVDELGMIPNDEHDHYDKERKCRYYIALYNNEPVGASRWREGGSGYKFERMCVLKDQRGKGIGAALLQKMMDDIPENLQLTLGCPTELIPFYEKFGFRKREKTYWESNVMYQHMKFYPEKTNN